MKVLVFAYRRWMSLDSLLRSLKEQGFKDVTIFIDGNRSEEDLNDVDKTEQIANEYLEFQVLRRPFNWGMYYNIVDGLLSAEDKEFVVLEEDLIVSKLKDAFAFFPTLFHEKIFSISLMSYLKAKDSECLDYFELDRFFCWGWYSQSSRIKSLNFNRISLALELSYPTPLLEGDLSSMYYRALSRKNNSWAAIVSVGSLKNNFKNLMFRGGFSKNIGFDGENLSLGHKRIFRQHLLHIPPRETKFTALSISDFWRIHWRFRKIFKAIIYFGKIFTRSS